MNYISRLEKLEAVTEPRKNASLCGVVVTGDEDVEEAKARFRAERDGAEPIAVIRVNPPL